MIGDTPVLIATTGIGATRAALCLDSLLRKFGDRTREVMFLGTAGGSPAVGGVIDSADCNTTRPAESDRVVRLGDVCVSPFATDWDCQRCFWADEPYRRPAPGERPVRVPHERNACARAPCSLHKRDPRPRQKENPTPGARRRWDLFGDFGCSYYADVALADELLAAAGRAAPPMPPRLAAYERAFWDATARAAPDWGAAHARAASRGARAWGYDACAEATSMTYFKGAPYDELARSYVADLLADARAGLGLAAPRAVSRTDVLAMSAMEGTGWMSVLKQSEVYLNFAPMPSANVRGVADYTHDPLVRYAADVWLEDPDWVEEAERMNYTVAGYRYAIQTTSAVVVALFDARAAARKA